MDILKVFFISFWESVNWTIDSITFQVPWYTNYFWGLILISFAVWGLEILFPWRKTQSIFRNDFWIDGFYMFFNFFVFSIAINGVYDVLLTLYHSFGFSSQSLALVNLKNYPTVIQLIVFFVLLDFVQWMTHIALHKFAFLWQFHKVHHSVKEMGFAAHMRYHWIENILYKPLKTLGIMILGGFEPEQAFIVHFATITIGHLNHANIRFTWGPLRFILNNPVMHLQHHAYKLPNGRLGVNFGISLSLWDYLFKTNYNAKINGNTKLGFPGDEHFPKKLLSQLGFGFKKTTD